MSSRSGLASCIDAFARRDYRACAEAVQAVLSTEVSLAAVQLLLISLQRCGAEDPAAVGRALLPRLTDPWERDLVRLTIGEINPSELVAAVDGGEVRTGKWSLPFAKDRRQDAQGRRLLQYRCYAGAQLVTLHHREAAEEFFRNAIIAFRKNSSAASRW